MNKKQLITYVAIAFFIGAIGSIFFGRLVFPYFASFPGLSWMNKLSTNAPIVINRTQEIQLNEGVNIIDLVRNAGNVTVTLFAVSDNNARFLGNGTIMTSDGLIFTSRRVLANLGSGKLVAVLNDGSKYDATAGPVDPRSDLLVLTIPAKNLRAAELANAKDLVTAQRVIGIGSAQAEGQRKFATGFVLSGMNNTQSLERVFTTNAFEETIETDANISPEYYGGPVINLNGKVVGMMGENRGNIIPSENLQTAMASYLLSGKIVRQFAGIKYLSLSGTQAKLKNLAQAGALVQGFENPSVAKNAGLLVNDFIISVNGSEITDNRSLEYMLNQHKEGEINLVVSRNGSQVEIKFTPQTND